MLTGAAEHRHARFGQQLYAVHRFAHPAHQRQPEHEALRRLVAIQPGPADPFDRDHRNVVDPASAQMGLKTEIALLEAGAEQFTAVIAQQGSQRTAPMVKVVRAHHGLQRAQARKIVLGTRLRYPYRQVGRW